MKQALISLSFYGKLRHYLNRLRHFLKCEICFAVFCFACFLVAICFGIYAAIRRTAGREARASHP